MQQSNIKKLGEIKHFTDLGNGIVVNPQKLPKIGSIVVTEQLEHVGRVIDIFGPVTEPYVSIRFKENKKEEIKVGNVVYSMPKRKRGSRRKMKYKSHYKKRK